MIRLALNVFETDKRLLDGQIMKLRQSFVAVYEAACRLESFRNDGTSHQMSF